MEAKTCALAAVGEKALTFFEAHRKLCITAVAVLGGLTVIKAVAACYDHVRRARRKAYLHSLEEGVVHVFMHRRWSHGPNFFPQCVKVETFLRLAKIPYVAHFTDDVSISPNGRLPLVVHNKAVLAESDFILPYLTQTFKVTLDDHLSQAQHAEGFMIKRMIESSIHYGLNRTIFVDFPQVLINMFSVEFNLQSIVASVLVHNMRANTIKVLNAVGYGNLSQEQYEREFLHELQSLETLLKTEHAGDGSGAFLLGPKPTSYDCSLYAWLQVAGEMGPHGPGLSFVATSNVLKEYVSRVSRIAFPDFDSLRTEHDTQRFTPE